MSLIMLDLAIVIVNYNVCDLLRDCLKSVYASTGVAQGRPLGFEVCVVDNASPDDSADMVARDFPQVHLIRNTQNMGYAAANNLGLKYFGFSDQQSAISNQRSAISDQRSAISHQQSAISDQQSAISNQQSESAISNQQSESAISHQSQRSAIRIRIRFRRARRACDVALDATSRSRDAPTKQKNAHSSCTFFLL
ncbi:MAG TPA: glycosyltransferase [Polyangiaceae bacterium]